MKRIALNLLLLLSIPLFWATTCKKENCHKIFYIKNGSPDTVIMALNWHNNSKCQLQGPSIPPNTNHPEVLLRACWEDELANGQTFSIYFVDPSKYNAPLIFYDCDSIEINNKVLKRMDITLDLLIKNDFSISYQ
jgi:hypothetical protein